MKDTLEGQYKKYIHTDNTLNVLPNHKLHPKHLKM